MDIQPPGISSTGIKDRLIVRVIDNIRQRLDNQDRRTVANPATLEQLKVLQDQITLLKTAAPPRQPAGQTQPTSVQAMTRTFAFFAG